MLRAGTIAVGDLDASRDAYERLLEYRTVETGRVDEALACAWGAPAIADAAFAVMQPASGADVYLRLVEQPPVASFEPLVTYGWAALEFCVRDVHGVAARLADSPSPFAIIGAPRGLDGLDGITAMQARGPDGEICYFTQIDADPPGFSLPRADSFVDRLFINVLAASDMAGTQRWMVRHLGCAVGRERMEIVYTMLAQAFDVPPEQRFAISTMVDGSAVFVEVDQMPPQARPRPRQPGWLPPGIALTTLSVAALDVGVGTDALLAPPAQHAGPLYDGCRSATLLGPDGALFELVEAR